MPTQLERRTATRLAVVEAAVHLFERAGSVDVPIDAIADHAGVAKSTVLYHFGSRSAVLRSVARQLQVGLEERVRGRLKGDDATAWVRAMLQEQVHPQSRLLHHIGDELAPAGELGGVDPLDYLTDRLSGMVEAGDPIVLAAAILQFGRQLAYGIVEPAAVDDYVEALRRGAFLEAERADVPVDLPPHRVDA